MSFLDRVKAWFKGESRRSTPSKSTATPTTEATKDLERFIREREGVEGYLEPKTAIYSMTLLLVAGDGEYLRRPVRDRDQAVSICKKHGLPMYEAQKVGYPKRMRDYDAGRRRDTVSLEDLPPWPGDDGPEGRDDDQEETDP
ncbi:MAG: oxidoreductase [Actinobacteria bacterium]|nr:oxidoreductase [Actinomycetota bacterium]